LLHKNDYKTNNFKIPGTTSDVSHHPQFELNRGLVAGRHSSILSVSLFGSLYHCLEAVALLGVCITVGRPHHYSGVCITVWEAAALFGRLYYCSGVCIIVREAISLFGAFITVWEAVSL
jgi:hypothetical protein